jgi:dienelactone hydrolase
MKTSYAMTGAARFGLLALLLFSGSAGAAAILPPHGPFRIGTSTIHLTHASRELMVQLWYPIDARTHGATASYLPSEKMPAEFVTRKYFALPEQEIESWRKLRTHAVLDARVSRARRFPLLTFSIGLGVSRANYTSIVSEVASHGYIVAAIDHPYGGITVLPDGQVLSLDDDPHTTDEERVVQWAADIRFVIDRLLTLEPFARSIDAKRIGAFGHSLGGAAALEASRVDSRILAACDMDGGPIGAVAESGVPKPFMLMRSQPVYSDADLARLGRTRSQWEQMGAKLRAALQPIFDQQPQVAKFQLQIAGAGHMSFSDAPAVMPETLTRFGGEILSPEKTLALVTGYLTAFFDEELNGRRSDLLHGRSAPPVTLTIYKESKESR